jgi:hypothetical protein
LAIGFSPNRPRIFAIGDNQEVTISKLEESEELEEPEESKN